MYPCRNQFSALIALKHGSTHSAVKLAPGGPESIARVMQFLVVRRRHLGVAISLKELEKIQPIRADVHIHECRSDALGRCCVEAWVHTSTSTNEVIPPLLDAKVNGVAQLGMNICGIEEVDGALYAQSWWCRLP